MISPCKSETLNFQLKGNVRKLLTLFPHILAHYNDLFNEILVVGSGSNIFIDIKCFASLLKSG